MEPIELLECLGCGCVYDQWSMIPHAFRCKRNRFAAIMPTRMNRLKWFLNEPIHVLRLYIQDVKEKLGRLGGLWG